jgi:class 3 adenylate cyclase/tetratricopeptide (TPR) repeat protein
VPIAADPLGPYVPRLVGDWLADDPHLLHRHVAGSLVFADISGFTALTERLAARGKAGAEEMGDILNATFEELLTAAYDYGASLIKWGGDAVLLLFDGEEHGPRAVRASWGMQEVMRTAGRVQTSRGVVRLGMSIGAHTGDIDFLLVGDRHRELIALGPTVTMTAHMEKVAERGQIVISPATAALLAPECIGTSAASGMVLARPPAVGPRPNRSPKRGDVDLGRAMCAQLRDHLRGGHGEHEHRSITVGFIEFSGTDELLATDGPDALAEAVSDLIDSAEAAAEANDVALLATDVAENGGKIILTSGAPVSAGEDETRVLSTVRRVVHPGGRLSLRAGVTHGSVFAGDYGPFYRKTYSIAGDCVNLAARLMGKAQAGQVVTLPAVVERSRSVFATTALEPFLVKGKTQPIEAVIVGDLRRASEAVVEDRMPLVGRQAELATLLEAATRAAGGAGQVVEIVAPAGLGKSRLIEELTSHAEARVLWADGDIYGRSTPYQPMQRLLRRTLALPPEVDDVTLERVLRDLVEGTAPDLVPWLPLIGVVAGLDLPPTPEVDILDHDVRRARVEAVTSDLLGRLLAAPIIMVVNDVQFMDEATVALVRRLALDAVDRPWLLVLTRRPEAPAVVGSVEHATEIELRPLPAAAAGELLELATTATPLRAHQLQQLVERADGNPLFLRQLVAAAAAGADLEALPDTVEGLIAAQIDRLPARRKRWLRSASVLGMIVDPALLDELLAGTDLHGEDGGGLDDLITMHQDGSLRFVHHLTRLTAYEGLPYRRRTELHARAAALLEPRIGEQAGQAALLSLHCLHGERYASAWHYSLAAGNAAREAYAPLEAAQCYQRARQAAQHLPDLSDRELAGACELLADVSMDLGQVDVAEQALRQARAHSTDDPHRLASLIYKTARHREHLGQLGASLRWVARGRKVLADLSDPVALRLRARLAEQRAVVHYLQGAFRTAAVWARRCTEEARRAGDALTEARGLGVSAVLSARAGEPWDQAGAREVLALFEQAGDLHETSQACNKLGMAAYFAGDWDAAIRYYLQAEQTASRIGRDHDGAIDAGNLAEVFVLQGSIDDAEAALVPAIRVLRAVRAKNHLGFALTLLGRVALARGEITVATEHLTEARALEVEMGEADQVLTIDALMAACHLAAGEPEAALAAATEAASTTISDPTAASLLRRIRGEALLELARIDEGRAELRTSLEIARASGARHEVEGALRALVRWTATPDPIELEAWATERAEIADSLGMVPWERTGPP